MKFSNKKYIFVNSGFTLIELIIVIAVIALLAAATFVAVDPAKRIGQARDAQRWQDVTAIADAIQQYQADNNGTFPTSTSDIPSMVGAGVSQGGYEIMVLGSEELFGSNCYPDSNFNIEPALGVSLSNLVPTYLPTMPINPSGIVAGVVTGYGVGYYLNRDSNGRIVVGACSESAYSTASIRVQR